MMPISKDTSLVRAFTVCVAIPLFRPVGFRPSDVYVDARRQPTAAPDVDRLSETVYEAWEAEPDDQLLERSGPVVLVAPDGRWWAVALTDPSPLLVAEAFTHARRQIDADRIQLQALLDGGQIAEVAKPRRVRGPSSRLPPRRFDSGHPLVMPGGAVAPLESRQGLH